MNLQQIQGTAKIVSGKLQKTVGDLIDNPEMFVRGARQETAGLLERRLGEVREIIEDCKRRRGH